VGKAYENMMTLFLAIFSGARPTIGTLEGFGISDMTPVGEDDPEEDESVEEDEPEEEEETEDVLKESEQCQSDETEAPRFLFKD
jgi:hypothetical protein